MTATNGSRIEILESAFVSSEEGNLFVQLAHAYRDSGDRLRAFRILRRGIEQHPTYGPAYELLGRVLLDQERIAEAEAVYERLLELEPRNSVARGALDDINQRMRPGPTTAATSLGTIPMGGPPSQQSSPPRTPPSMTATGNWLPATEPAPKRANGDSPATSPPPAPQATAPQATAPQEAAPQPVAPQTAAPPARAPRPEPVLTSEAQALEVSLKQTGLEEEQMPMGERVDPTALALADMLVGLVEYRDPFFRGNTSLTRLLTVALARELKIGAEATSAIALGAVLRDVGQFPLRNVLNRPGLELPAGARKNMERHVDTALEMMSGVKLPQITRDAVRHHHERFDGDGYPDGLKGDAIPLGARIVAVADSFSAMISARPHRLPKRVPVALDDVRAAAGTQFDATVVDALVRIVESTNWKGPGFSLRHHVLIVDPDETRAMVTATRLCSHGYLAEAVFQIDAAMDRLEKTRIVAIIVSSELPGADEAAFMKQVRETTRIATTPIIMTDAGSAERVRLLEAGADVCLSQDAVFEELKATLEAFLRREGKTVPPAELNSMDAGWSRLQGDIQDFPLNWLLQVLNYDSRTAAVYIVTPGDEGVIYIERGAPVHAQTRFMGGEDAFRAMLNWQTGSFTVKPDSTTDQRTVNISLMNLLLETAVAEDLASFFGAIQSDEATH
ncbi:MAG: HD domain-containing phosphohydrolase [Gemmatimonadota bacterium]